MASDKSSQFQSTDDYKQSFGTRGSNAQCPPKSDGAYWGCRGCSSGGWGEPASALLPDPVFRPEHYSRFAIEPITFINANRLAYNIGNVVKYVCRYDAKNGLEDLKKARRYLDIQIECMDRERRVKDGEDPRAVWSVPL